MGEMKTLSLEEAVAAVIALMQWFVSEGESVEIEQWPTNAND